MKYVKMLGLAAVAAMALMAFAGSASATIIESGSGQLLKGSAIDASLTGSETAKLEAGSLVLDECTGGTVEGITSNNGSSTETVKGEVSKANLTWSGCSRTTNTLAGGNLEIHWTSGANGTLTATGFEVTVSTIFGSCIYGFGTTAKNLGEVKGGTPATLSIKTSVPKISGPCPSESNWTANYTVTNPGTLRVTEKQGGNG
jgi:hypothetical protein